MNLPFSLSKSQFYSSVFIKTLVMIYIVVCLVKMICLDYNDWGKCVKRRTGWPAYDGAEGCPGPSP